MRLKLTVALLLYSIIPVKQELHILYNEVKNEDMNFSSNFTKIVEQHEGFRATMYKDANGFPTIGYGTMIDSAQLNYLMTATINEAEAEQLLFFKASHIKFTLNNLIAHGLKINQNQFDALADFAYNVGENALLQSTLLKIIMSNPDNLAEVEKQFLAWDKIVKVDQHGNKEEIVLPGLETRRVDEFKLYSTPVA